MDGPLMWPMRWDKFVAQQLGRPSGLIGQLILGPVWNKRNAALNDVAFDHLALNPHDRVLEVGFGGGYLLSRISTVVTEGFPGRRGCVAGDGGLVRKTLCVARPGRQARTQMRPEPSLCRILTRTLPKCVR